MWNRAEGPVQLLYKAEFLVQSLCKQGFGWDEELPEKIKKEWRVIQEPWNKGEKYSISRKLDVSLGEDDIELHAFVDVLKEACISRLSDKS
ncbi:unnamed protein product [Enterobius vermicularis]|uniref:PNT domain-containing protein n=1 Tax=Enterobius vermicularis TaxID=51028 RepID=A0A0N4VJ88_ENTVE|nr:unnamed protein product [Enterobius vermicularis]